MRMNTTVRTIRPLLDDFRCPACIGTCTGDEPLTLVRVHEPHAQIGTFGPLQFSLRQGQLTFVRLGRIRMRSEIRSHRGTQCQEH